jgi:hypothetical protein
MRLLVPYVTVLPAAVACTSLLGIDGDYRYENDAGNPVGGASAGGGVPSGGAASGTGGRGGASTGGRPADASPDGARCPEGEKWCPFEDLGETCIRPNPLVGCGPMGCTPCPDAPMGGYSICSGADGTECSFDCRAGFVRNAAEGTCDPAGSSDGGGGAAGAPATGGAGGCAADSDCPRCSETLPACCTLLPPRQCGCQFPFWCQPSG